MKKSLKNKNWLFAWIALAGIISFAPTLRVGFMWDDHEMIEKNKAITSISISNIKHAFSGDVFDGKGDAYYRPLQTIVNMVDHQLWGLRPLGYHLTNLFFHLAAAVLLFLILSAAFSSSVAFVTALFFAVHPIIIEQLLIIAGRAELMAAAFVFLAIWAALRKTTLSYLLAGLFYLLACLSKESGVIFPLLLVTFGLIDKKRRVPSWAYVLFAAIFAAYMSLRQSAVPGSIVPPAGELLTFSWRDFPSIVLKYIQTLILPLDLHSHRRMEFPSSWQFLAPSFLILALVLAFFRKSKAVWFALAWFFIGLLPKIPNLATNMLMLDHWAYVSGIGVYLLLALAFEKIKPPVRWMAVGVAALFWTGLSWVNAGHRSTDFKLYEWALRFPSSSIVRANLGLTYFQMGEYQKAIVRLEESLAMNPGSINTSNILALSYWNTGRPKRALEILSECLKKDPNNAQSRYHYDLLIKKKDLKRSVPAT